MQSMKSILKCLSLEKKKEKYKGNNFSIYSDSEKIRNAPTEDCALLYAYQVVLNNKDDEDSHIEYSIKNFKENLFWKGNKLDVCMETGQRDLTNEDFDPEYPKQYSKLIDLS